MRKLRESAYRLLRWSEKYTKTDMVYTAESGFWLNSNYIIGSFLGLGLTVLYAYFLSKETFGMYKYVISVAGLAVAFSLNGINVAVAGAVARGYEGILKRSIMVQMRWVIPQALFSLIFSAYYFSHGNTLYGASFLIAGILAPISSIANTYTAFLQGKKDFKTLSLYGIASNLVYVAAVAAAVISATNVVYLSLAYFGANAAANVYYCWRTFKKYRPSTSFLEEDITFGKHVSAQNILGIIAGQIDSFVLYHFMGPASLAVYTFAIAIPERVRYMFGFIATAALPKLSERPESAGPANVRRKTIQLLILAAATSLIYIVCAPFIFKWFFPQYLGSVIYSQVFSISLIAIAANISMSALFASRLHKELYISGTVGPIFKIVVLLIAIYYYGIWGAIVARILSHAFGTLLPFLLLERSHNRTPS